MNGMISRRKYVSMTMMMLVLLFMFQFTQVIKDRDNDYSTNQYAAQSVQDGSKAWKMKQDAQNNVLISSKESYVAFLGSTKNQLGSIVEQWCTYTKRDLIEYASVQELKEIKKNPPEVLLIDAGYVDFEKETYTLFGLAKKGVSMVFCNLPDVQEIENNEKLRELLGVRSVESAEVELSAIKLFSGFLLGGEVIYNVEEGLTQERQDLDVTLPWYVVFTGTKTYMVGMLADETVKNEQLPAIIWRNSVREAKIFAVNGDYMYDSTGIGMLDAMMAELHPYELYPVVNAQNLTIANFPGFAEENTEEMMRLYSRSQSVLARDIIWPGITATAKKNRQPETLFFMAQADYADENEPQDLNYVFYLKELKEQKAEAAVSFCNPKDDIKLSQKIKQDGAFFEEVNEGYQFTAAFTDDVSEAERLAATIPSKEAFQKVRTIVQKYAPQTPVVAYLNDDITLQNTTSDGFDYTYSQDLRMRSLQTALGYSNILMDMYPLSWPQSTEQVWEKMYDSFSRNINTFWKPFTIFAKTTASESDNRVRKLLGLDYEDTCEENMISLQVDNLGEDAWFILRTQEQEIEKADGAEFQKIEEDAYLLRIKEKNVRIYLKDTGALYYYLKE